MRMPYRSLAFVIVGIASGSLASEGTASDNQQKVKPLSAAGLEYFRIEVLFRVT